MRAVIFGKSILNFEFELEVRFRFSVNQIRFSVIQLRIEFRYFKDAGVVRMPSLASTNANHRCRVVVGDHRFISLHHQSTIKGWPRLVRHGRDLEHGKGKITEIPFFTLGSQTLRRGNVRNFSTDATNVHNS